MLWYETQLFPLPFPADKDRDLVGACSVHLSVYLPDTVRIHKRRRDGNRLFPYIPEPGLSVLSGRGKYQAKRSISKQRQPWLGIDAIGIIIRYMYRYPGYF